ncbi:MAG TPA: hypothetical protein VGB17_18345 [Pyrinomonadaceae bacterium]|jgi:hypothetical protein
MLYLKQSLPGRKLLRSIALDQSVRAALFAFLLTRILVFTIFILTAYLSIPTKSFGRQVKEAELSLDQRSIPQKLVQLAQAADANWYMGIAGGGYERGPFTAESQHTWAYFPLYPMVLWLGGMITGELPLTGMALSNIFLLAALILLHKTALAFGCDEGCADRAVFYTAAFPVSYFFSLPLTESLFLCLTVGSFYAARRDAWWTACVLGALASATRVGGILLLPALSMLYWQQHGFKLKMKAASLLLIPLGLLSFMLYLHFLTGNALAFKDAQAAWGRSYSFFLSPLYDYLVHFRLIVTTWNFKLLNFASAILAFACGFVLLKRREWALALYTLLSVIVPLSSNTLQGVDRYVMTIFPVFIVLARAGRGPRLDQTIRTIFIALLGLLAALFAARFSLAMV